MLITFFLLVGIESIFGQGAAFDVNSNVGCNPFTVVVTDLSGAPDTVAVNYDWGDGSPLDSTEYHTYTQPGIYRIIQTVANANPRQDTAFVEVVNQYPPEFYLFNCKGTRGSVLVQDTLYERFEIDWGDGNVILAGPNTLVSHNYGVIGAFDVTVKGLINGMQSPLDSSNLNCDATTKRLNTIIDIQPATINQVQVLSTDPTSGSISVDYTLDPGSSYLVEVLESGASSFVILDTINQVLNPNNYVIQNINTATTYDCISITAFDPCDGDRRLSNLGCSILLDGVAQNQENQLFWNTESPEFLSYTVTKDGQNIAQINDETQQQYIDDQVFCGSRHTYQVIMEELGGLVSISDTITLTAISSEPPDPILDISATVIGQDIQLFWEAPTNYLASGYIISRSENGVSFEVIDTVDVTEFLDTDLFTQSTQYYYQIQFFDACDNVSAESVIAVPVLLVAEYDKTLNWSEYLGWENGVREYILEKYDETGLLIDRISMGLTTTYQEDASNPFQVILYKVIAVPNDEANGEVESNILEVIYRSKVAFPNAFSPDGDGMNDIFNFESRYITAVNMKIYNRWGELVYQTTDIDRGWDGTVNGKPAPLGTYIHHTELTDDMGITFVKSGEIVLIR